MIGTAREPGKATELSALPNTHVVRLDTADLPSIAEAAEEIAVLAPAGIDQLWNVIFSSSSAKLLKHMC